MEVAVFAGSRSCRFRWRMGPLPLPDGRSRQRPYSGCGKGGMCSCRFCRCLGFGGLSRFERGCRFCRFFDIDGVSSGHPCGPGSDPGGGCRFCRDFRFCGFRYGAWGVIILVVLFIAPTGGAKGGFADLDTNEEVVGAQVLIRDEAQGNGRLGGARAGAGAVRLLTGGDSGWSGGNESRVELAGGRLETNTLAVAIGGIGQLLREGAVRVVVVPEESGGDHVCPSSLWWVGRASEGLYGSEFLLRTSVQYSIKRKNAGVKQDGKERAVRLVPATYAASRTYLGHEHNRT